MRITAQVFNCSESTFFVVFNRVIDFLLNYMPHVIKMPNTIEEKKEIANEFKQVYFIRINTIICRFFFK